MRSHGLFTEVHNPEMFIERWFVDKDFILLLRMRTRG